MLIVTFCNFVKAPKKRSRGLLVIFCCYSGGDMLICYLEDRKFCLMIVGRNTRFFPVILPDMSLSCIDHWDVSAAVTFLISTWSSIRMCGIHIPHWQNFFQNTLRESVLRCRSYFLSVHSLPTVLMWQSFDFWAHFGCFLNTVARLFEWFLTVFVSVVPVICSGFFKSLIFMNLIEV